MSHRSTNHSLSTQPFTCDVCQKSFTRHENLKRHAVLHESSRSTKTHSCHICRTTFARSDLQHRHMKRKHPDVVGRGPASRHQIRHDSAVSTNEPWPNYGSPHSSSVDSRSPEAQQVVLQMAEAEHSRSYCSDGHMRNVNSYAHASAHWASPEDEELDHVSYMDCSSRSPPATHVAYGSLDASPVNGWTRRGLELFFTSCAPALPFIHEPTFNTETAAEHLVLAMLCLGYHHGDGSQSIDQRASSTSISLQCYEKALSMVDCIHDDQLSIPLDALALVQSMLLLEVHAILHLCGRHSATGLRLHSRIVALTRSAKLTQAMPQPSTVGEDLDAVWQQFIVAESCKRTMLAVHQIDALWYTILSMPRLISHLEIKHQLPCPIDDWRASTSAQWAYRRLTDKASSAAPSYPEAVCHLLTGRTTLHELLAIADPFGLTNFAHFALSSIREISGWSTITGCVSMDRVEPLKSSLLTLSPYNQPDGNGGSSHSRNISFRTTWEMAIIDLHIWSLSHTNGVVHTSIDDALEHSTHLAASCDLVFNSQIVRTIQPHVNWFLQYLDTTADLEDESPWVVLFAYKVFLMAWQCLHQGLEEVMDIVEMLVKDTRTAVRWARKVFGRRRHWEHGRIIMHCLDVLDEVS